MRKYIAELLEKVFHGIKPFLFAICAVCVLGLIIFFHGESAQAATTCTATASGNWNTTGTWDCGHVPLATDDVVVSAATSVTVTVDTAAVANSVTVTDTAVSGTQNIILAVGSNSLTISSGGGLTINGGGASNRNAEVTVSTGTITVPDSVTFNNVRAQFISTGASTLNVGGNFGSGGTLTTTNTGTINFNGGLAQTIGAYTTYNNVQINNSSGGVSYTGTTTINGTLLINAGTLNTSTFTSVVVGTTTVNGTLLISSTTGAKTFGDLTIANGGVMNFTAAEAITENGNLAVNGTGTITGTTGVWTFQRTGGSGTISGTGTGVSLASSTFTTSYAVSIPFTSPTVTVTGTTLTNNSTITANTAVSGTGTLTQGIGSTLNIGGTSGISSLVATANTNTVNYTSTTANQTIIGTTYHHLTINKSGRVGTLGAAATVNGDLSVSAGTLADGGFQITGNATGALSLSAATTLTLGTTTGATAFPTGYTSVHTNLNATSTVTYNSNLAQNISAVPTYGSLSLASTATVTKTALGPLTISSNLTVGSNNTLDDAGNTLTVNGNATATGTHIGSGKIVLSGGAASHTISGTGFNNLELNDTNGAALTGATSVAGTLTLNSGTLTLGAFAFTVTGTTTVNTGTSISITSGTGTKAIGDLVINGTGTITGTAGTLTFQKVGGGTISGTATSLNLSSVGATFTSSYILPFPFTAAALTVTGAGVTVTNTSTTTVNGTLAGTGAFTQNAGTTLNVRSITITTLNASATGNLVDFTGGAGSLKGTTYNNVDIDKTTATSLTASGTVSINGNLNVNSGTLNLASSTFTVTGTTDIFDTITDSSGGVAGGSNNFVGQVTGHAAAVWTAILGEVCDFNFSNGLVFNGTSFTSSTGVYRFSTNNQTVSGTLPLTITNVEVNGVHLTNSSIATITNLTVNTAGAYVSSGDLTINGTLTLAAGNPTSTTGTLVMGSATLTLGSSANTVGSGDVTGIVKRTSLLANTSYTFGNQFTVVNFNNTGTLPTEMSIKTTIGTAPTWKSGAVLRTYSVIQTGAINSFATIHVHYLDSELNGNTENSLVFVRSTSPFTPGTETEFSRANYDTTDNWVGIAGVPVHGLPSAFGTAEATLANTTLVTSTWSGTVSTDWLDPRNWSPNGIPSDSANIIIPDAAGTSFDPLLPTSAIIAKTITIQSGGILNASSTSNLTITGDGGAWNNVGTFNPSTSMLIFTNAGATIAGTTDFYDITINSGATVSMQTNSVSHIHGSVTNNGTWNAAQLVNTVDYSEAAQAVIAPNGATPGYYNLTLSGSGTKSLPGSTLAVRGNMVLSGTVSVTALAILNIGCDLRIGSGTSFDAGSFTHTVGCNFINNGSFAASTSTFRFNGSVSQDLSGTSSTIFHGFTVDNSSGLTLTGLNPTINGLLTFTQGAVTTGTNTLYVNSTGSVTQTSGYVIGNLKKYIGTGPTAVTFEVGNGSLYTPIDIAFGNVTHDGDLTVNAGSGDCSTIGTSTISPSKSVNVCWQTTNTSIAFNNYNVVFHFINPDSFDSGANPNNFIVGSYNGGWTYPTVGTRTSTTIQALTLTSFNTFQVGQSESAPTATSVSITGTAQVANVLTGTYTYNDVDGDLEGVSTFRWLRNGVAIPGATSITYTLVMADSGQTINFEVTPVAQTGQTTGTPVQDGGLLILNSAPTASNIGISGTSTLGSTLLGTYTYNDVDGDLEGVSTFRWLRNGVAIPGATSTNYVLVNDDGGSTMVFEVTPNAASGTTAGLSGQSAGLLIPASAGTPIPVVAPRGGPSGPSQPVVPPQQPQQPTQDQPTDSSIVLAERAARVALFPTPVHSLVKLVNDNNPVTQEDSTVYYLGADGYRHIFPNPKVYFTWFCDFSLVKTITADQLARIPLGANITYRPGLRMIKFSTSSTVYAVQKGSILRAIPTEEMASQLYGDDWNTKIDDVSEVFFSNYSFGPMLNSVADFNPPQASESVAVPSDNFGLMDYIQENSGVAFMCSLPVTNDTHTSVWPYIFPRSWRFDIDILPGSNDATSIRYLQDFLKKEGQSIYPEGLVTGQYATLTISALKRYQTLHHLNPTGSFDESTRMFVNQFLNDIGKL